MPELPEVETTRRGLAPAVTGRRITGLVVRNSRLRWPIAPELSSQVAGRRIAGVTRRGKYLLLNLEHQGSILIHLGMSGSLRLVPPGEDPGPSDHLDIALEGAVVLRLRDPRRFGCVLWAERPADHALLRFMGPEPLEGHPGAHLYASARGRTRAVRDFLLDGRIVAGIGNIYANEALFRAGIDPRRAAGRISAARYQRLGTALVDTLEEAITAGGTTLRDFVGGSGRPGYFQQALKVYGRKGMPCLQCGAPIRAATCGQRSLYFCSTCQA